MEKYYIVTDSKLGRDYMEYKEKLVAMNEHVKAFMDKHGIEARKYIAGKDVFFIVPTDGDIENFERQLTKDKGNKTRRFKCNSKIGKDWTKTVKDNNIVIAQRPFVEFHFKNISGRSRTRLFDIDGIVYCSMESGHDTAPAREGMQEIKASEFFKAIENAQERRE